MVLKGQTLHTIALFLKEIIDVKKYLAIFIFTGIILGACASKETKNAQAIEKEEEDAGASAELKLNGLENLNKSNIMKDILCQTWDYKEDAEDAKGMDITSGMEVVYRGYCFFKDGTVIKDQRGNLSIGKWTMNDQVKPITLSMEFDNGNKEFRQLAYLMPYEMILADNSDKSKNKIDLSSEAIRHINMQDDPFYTSNILWRIKPKAPETNEQIKQRLKACIHFFVLFYDQKINAHSETVSFIGLPTCFNWYSGGITIPKEDKLQEKWVNCFYNRQQALKAFRMADKLIGFKYDWPKNESNWLKLSVAVLKQMEKKIDSLDGEGT
jgi:hypothetical protein